MSSRCMSYFLFRYMRRTEYTKRPSGAKAKAVTSSSMLTEGLSKSCASAGCGEQGKRPEMHADRIGTSAARRVGAHRAVVLAGKAGDRVLRGSGEKSRLPIRPRQEQSSALPGPDFPIGISALRIRVMAWGEAR